MSCDKVVVWECARRGSVQQWDNEKHNGLHNSCVPSHTKPPDSHRDVRGQGRELKLFVLDMEVAKGRTPPRALQPQAPSPSVQMSHNTLMNSKKLATPVSESCQLCVHPPSPRTAPPARGAHAVSTLTQLHVEHRRHILSLSLSCPPRMLRHAHRRITKNSFGSPYHHSDGRTGMRR